MLKNNDAWGDVLVVAKTATKAAAEATRTNIRYVPTVPRALPTNRQQHQAQPRENNENEPVMALPAHRAQPSATAPAEAKVKEETSMTAPDDEETLVDHTEGDLTTSGRGEATSAAPAPMHTRERPEWTPPQWNMPAIAQKLKNIQELSTRIQTIQKRRAAMLALLKTETLSIAANQAKLIARLTGLIGPNMLKTPPPRALPAVSFGTRKAVPRVVAKNARIIPRPAPEMQEDTQMQATDRNFRGQAKDYKFQLKR